MNSANVIDIQTRLPRASALDLSWNAHVIHVSRVKAKGKLLTLQIAMKDSGAYGLFILETEGTKLRDFSNDGAPPAVYGSMPDAMKAARDFAVAWLDEMPVSKLGGE